MPKIGGVFRFFVAKNFLENKLIVNFFIRKEK